MRFRTTRFATAASTLAVLAALLTCDTDNHPPDIPVLTTWPRGPLPGQNVEYRATVFDVDGDEVAVRYEWADSGESEWSEFFASGCTIVTPHTWTDTGEFNVRVRARDGRGRVSWWSPYARVAVGVPRPPESPVWPDKPTWGLVDSAYVFRLLVEDLNGDQVTVRVSWGDGDTSDWTGPVAPGDTVALSHTWTYADTFTTRALARDAGGAVSPWSDARAFVVRTDTLRKWRSRIWESGLYTALTFCPAVGRDGAVYVGSRHGEIRAFNVDGSTRWLRIVGDGTFGSPTLGPDGTIYLCSSDSFLYALDPDGSLHWRVMLSASLSPAPALAEDGTIYVAGADSLYAVTPDGVVRWRSSIEEASSYSAPVVEPCGRIYICNRLGVVFAFDQSGGLLWRRDLAQSVRATPAIGNDGAVYVTGRDTLLTALNRDGTIRWSFGSGSAYRSSPVIADDGTIIFVGTDSCLYGVTPQGGLRWRHSTDGHAYSSPAIAADGTVYFGTYKHIYALGVDGSTRWCIEQSYVSYLLPTIARDGTLYFTATDGWLYALKGTAPLADSPWPKFGHDARNTGRFGAR